MTKSMSKEEFMKRYVLARAAAIDGSPDIPAIVRRAEEAWNLIQSRCGT